MNRRDPGLGCSMRDPTWITPPRAARDSRSIRTRPAKGRAALTHSHSRAMFCESQLQLCKNTKAISGGNYTKAYTGNMTEIGSVSHIMSYRCMDGHFMPLRQDKLLPS